MIRPPKMISSRLEMVAWEISTPKPCDSQPEAFTLDLSFRVLFMIIIGGIGSILGSFLGAAFITVFPIFLNRSSEWLASVLGVEISHAAVSNLELIIFGGLIIFFLIVEPNGLARLWQIAKEKLRLWPFPH